MTPAWRTFAAWILLILPFLCTVEPFVKSNCGPTAKHYVRRGLAVNAQHSKSPKRYYGREGKKKGYGGNWRQNQNPRRPKKPGQTDSGLFDVRRLTPGKVVEYTNAKGSRRVVLINKRLGTYLEVTNDVSKIFTIPVNRVNYLVEGEYTFEDLNNLGEIIQSLGPSHIERVYQNLTEAVCERGESKSVAYTLEYISNILHPLLLEGGGGGSFNEEDEEGDGDVDRKEKEEQYAPVSHCDDSQPQSAVFLSEPAKIYVAYRLMGLYGSVFFSTKDTDELKDGYIVHGLGLGAIAAAAANRNIINVYVPLGPSQVSTNRKERAALREFKARYKKLVELSAANAMEKRGFAQEQDSAGKRGSGTATSGSSSSTRALATAGMIMPDIPQRVSSVVNSYAEGLKQIVIQRHPWVLQGWARQRLDEGEAAKGRELLEFLDLAPSAKNARKVLEVAGMWKQHVNVEKYIMGIRDEFPANVMAEARYLVENYHHIADTDERIRRDMRHLGAYAIDREGAVEIDDAVSIEYLENGKEKLWIHIADVSRWVRPGSQLSLEAEKRMTSLYMPDERISMFPEVLTTELLSLGAMIDSYALSCGVTLSEQGEVETYEVCPSRIRVTRRLSYQQLDDILAAQKQEGGGNRDGEERPPSASLSGSAKMAFDLGRLHRCALLRNRRRIEQDGALDDMLRHKTELTLVVRERDVGTGGKHQQGRGATNNRGNGRGQARPPSNSSSTWSSWGAGPRGKPQAETTPLNFAAPRTKVVVNGYTSWSNASSVSLVSEYMVLMCQIMGKMCSTNDIPVWYKTQKLFPALQPKDLELQDGENLFLRSARIISHLRSANDSLVPGLHATTGSREYVQCTSPIRRYHDLYNHYRLKAAMHAASLGPDYEDRAQEEAGITMLDQMATAEERLQTLLACRRVTRHREGYWMRSYIEKLCNIVNPRYEFDVMVSSRRGGYSEELWDQCLFPQFGSSSSSQGQGDKQQQSSKSQGEGEGEGSEALIMQLGTFKPYLLYHKQPLKKGQSLRCHLYKQYTNPVSYILLPVEEPLTALPALLRDRLLSGKGKEKAFTSAFESNRRRR